MTSEEAVGEFTYAWTVRMLPNPFQDAGNPLLAHIADMASTSTRRLEFFVPDDILIECSCRSSVELSGEDIRNLVIGLATDFRRAQKDAIVVPGAVSLMTPHVSTAYLSLPEYIRDYLAQAVEVVGPADDRVPGSLHEKIKAASHGMSRGLACCHYDDSTGAITIIVVDPDPTMTTIQHEAIHAAQIHAAEDVMETAFRAAADLGCVVLSRVEDVMGVMPDANGQYRDIGWMLGALSGSHGLDAFDMARMLCPRDETMELLADYDDLDKASVVASLSAAILLDGGFDDWTGNLAREIVAYRYQAAEDCRVIENLFASAVVAHALISDHAISSRSP